MEHQTVHLLDLPDEILLLIIKQLCSADILYSLLGVNKRIDQMARCFTHTKSLDLSSLLPDIFHSRWKVNYAVLNRFRHLILPQIHQNLKMLIVEGCWMKKILHAAEYPQLRMISIRNCLPLMDCRYLTEESSMARLFKEQITHITIISRRPVGSRIFFTNACGSLFAACKKLIFFDSRRLCNSKCTELSFFHVPSNTCYSSQIRFLYVNVSLFDDCLCLLDGRLNQLSSLTIYIKSIERFSIITTNMNVLPNLKEFSLTSYSLTNAYDSRIISLLRCMINLVKLGLYLNIKRKRFINGIHFNERVLPYLSKLHLFQFHLTTTISTYNTIHLLSANDIQKTFTDWKYSPVNCSVYYFANQLGVSHIYSTTVKLTSLKFIANRFRRSPFPFVTDLKLYGTSSFEHHFFEWIARAFPLLKYFTLHNLTPQENKRNGKQNSSIIKYLHLITLNLSNIHIDYARQFLCHTNTHYANLHTLMIEYEQLEIVTNYFTSDLTRINCAQVRQLLTNELNVYPKHFYLYFPFCEK